jgi:hypothetical protein
MDFDFHEFQKRCKEEMPKKWRDCHFPWRQEEKRDGKWFYFADEEDRGRWEALLESSPSDAMNEMDRRRSLRRACFTAFVEVLKLVVDPAVASRLKGARVVIAEGAGNRPNSGDFTWGVVLSVVYEICGAEVHLVVDDRFLKGTDPMYNGDEEMRTHPDGRIDYLHVYEQYLRKQGTVHIISGHADSRVGLLATWMKLANESSVRTMIFIFLNHTSQKGLVLPDGKVLVPGDLSWMMRVSREKAVFMLVDACYSCDVLGEALSQAKGAVDAADPFPNLVVLTTAPPGALCWVSKFVHMCDDPCQGWVPPGSLALRMWSKVVFRGIARPGLTFGDLVEELNNHAVGFLYTALVGEGHVVGDYHPVGHQEAVDVPEVQQIDDRDAICANWEDEEKRAVDGRTGAEQVAPAAVIRRFHGVRGVESGESGDGVRYRLREAVRGAFPGECVEVRHRMCWKTQLVAQWASDEFELGRHDLGELICHVQPLLLSGESSIAEIEERLITWCRDQRREGYRVPGRGEMSADETIWGRPGMEWAHCREWGGGEMTGEAGSGT